MMSHHLPVVLPVGLRVQDKDLVKIESTLGKIVEFECACKGYMRVFGPDVNGVQDVCGEVEVYPLYWYFRVV